MLPVQMKKRTYTIIIIGYEETNKIHMQCCYESNRSNVHAFKLHSQESYIDFHSSFIIILNRTNRNRFILILY